MAVLVRGKSQVYSINFSASNIVNYKKFTTVGSFSISSGKANIMQSLRRCVSDEA